MSKWSSVLDEVVSFLNTLTLSQTFNAESSYKPRIVLNKITNAEISVIVFPLTMRRELINRRTVSKNHEVSVVVTKKLPGDNQDLDAMVDFVEEIATSLDVHKFTSGSTTTESVVESVYDHEKLNDSVFQSIVTIVFKIYD